MKTLAKMFAVWCWCMCLCTVSFAKEAVSQEEILNPTLEPLEQRITPEQKLQNHEENSIESRKAADLQIIEEKRQAALDAKLQAINELKNSQIKNILSFEEEFPTISDEIADDILKAMVEKGFNSVEEYLDYIAANEAALTKEGAVSFETYLQGLNAKEQAVILEYVLQNSSNEGVIVNNNKMPHFKGFSPERNPMDLDKVEYY